MKVRVTMFEQPVEVADEAELLDLQRQGIVVEVIDEKPKTEAKATKAEPEKKEG